MTIYDYVEIIRKDARANHASGDVRLVGPLIETVKYPDKPDRVQAQWRVEISTLPDYVEARWEPVATLFANTVDNGVIDIRPYGATAYWIKRMFRGPEEWVLDVTAQD